MRRHLFLLAAWLSLAGPGACAASATGPAAPPLRYWFWWEATSFDTYNGDHFDVMQVARNIYATLVSIGLDGIPQGMAADDWKVDGAGRTWRFHIRKGMRFENEEPITPQVVLRNFRRIFWLTRKENLPLNSLLPELSSWTDYGKPLKSVYVEGDFLVFRFNRRPHDLFEMLSHPVYGIASPDCFDGSGKWKQPYCSVASGQYRVASRTSGEIVLESRKVFPALADSPAAVIINTPGPGNKNGIKELFAGNGDIAIQPGFALGKETSDRITKAGYKCTEEPPSRMYFVQLNHKKPPFNDLRLRRSIRDVFLSLLSKNPYFRGSLDPSFLPKGGVGYLPFPVPDRIKAEAAGSGKVDVMFFPLAAYLDGSDSEMQEAAEKSFLEALRLHGFTPVVKRYVDRGDVTKRYLSGDYTAFLRGSGIMINDPYAGLKMMFLSRISAMIPDPSGSAAAYIERANLEDVPEKRRVLLEKMNRAVFDDAAVITFAHSSWVYVHRQSVDMRRFNLFMDPVEFRAIGWKPSGGQGGK